ncbi:MAG: HAMP domain-containing histidine kinase [Streptosporangiaceae bacterium]|nr:HAMP domain-containing histidine kinase [Streptosporangiaceae bacterium]MBV9857690.1 HAMP domain-containing histidine kinase [Streptosporangiaceae bacterium]
MIRCRWHRSLQLRVIGTTLVISAAVIAVLGFFLTEQIAAGLLLKAEHSARIQTLAGLNIARAMPNLNTPPTGAQAERFMYDAALALQPPSNENTGYYVAVGLSPGATHGPMPTPWASSVDPTASIPAPLIADVLKEQGVQGHGGDENLLFYSPTTLVFYDGGPQQPAVAVGAPLGNYYQLYFIFPLDTEQQTLLLVQRVLVGAGIALVALLAAIASLVTRWVVLPVRHAARAAQRLSAGHLSERMAVGGADDLGALATSFNDMAESLQEKLRQLEELSKVQRQFVSDVSHELRTPLSTIRMAADVLHESREQLDPASARSAELLQSQTERFEVLLTDLLEISRHDANVATLDAESADVCDIVRRAADDAQQLAERRGCRIEFYLPPEPCLAEVDRRRVERILRNLLVNAVEHGEGKNVAVTVGADRDAVAVAVRDHGVGLAPGEEQLVFDRFWRADPARARTTGGTGLGLAIALEDARLHGGWLQAWGEKGKGSVFRLTVPRSAGQPMAGSPLPLGPDDTEVVTSATVLEAELAGGLAAAEDGLDGPGGPGGPGAAALDAASAGLVNPGAGDEVGARG